jgi:hypothetical protein
MKVHFGGSGTGLEKIPANYLLIRRSLRKIGYSLTRDWLNPQVDKKTSSSAMAFQETVKAINNSDAVILEGTYDTSSVGKQLMLALNLELPVLILYYRNLDANSSLDKFIDKETSKLVKRAVYTEVNLNEKLEDFFSWASKNTNTVRFNLEVERRLDNYLKNKAKRNKTSKSEEIRKLIVEDMGNSL